VINFGENRQEFYKPGGKALADSEMAAAFRSDHPYYEAPRDMVWRDRSLIDTLRNIAKYSIRGFAAPYARLSAEQQPLSEDLGDWGFEDWEAMDLPITREKPE
jgi:hypothetical protein